MKHDNSNTCLPIVVKAAELYEVHSSPKHHDEGRI